MNRAPAPPHHTDPDQVRDDRLRTTLSSDPDEDRRNGSQIPERGGQEEDHYRRSGEEAQRGQVNPAEGVEANR